MTFLKKSFGALLCLFAWASIIGQLYWRTGSLANFFSFFTILSNLFVAVSLSFSVFSPNSGGGRFFLRLSVQSAIMLYIFMVGLVYNTILRGLASPTGIHLMLDTALHVIVPLLYTIYWLFFRTQGMLAWREGLDWTYFPLLYLVYSLIRGHFNHWYPYPFLNVDKLGYATVAQNCGLMLVVFLAVGFLLIGLTRITSTKQNS